VVATPHNTHRFIGAWRLVSYETESNDGTRNHPFGSDPNGLIILDASGDFSVQIDLPPAAEPGSAPRYVAFFGSWSFDETAGELVLVPRGTLNQQLTGTTQRRRFQFDEPLLRLYPPPVAVDGGAMTTTVTWRRVVSA
jgi:hypothetical protein